MPTNDAPISMPSTQPNLSMELHLLDQRGRPSHVSTPETSREDLYINTPHITHHNIIVTNVTLKSLLNDGDLLKNFQKDSFSERINESMHMILANTRERRRGKKSTIVTFEKLSKRRTRPSTSRLRKLGVLGLLNWR